VGAVERWQKHERFRGKWNLALLFASRKDYFLSQNLYICGIRSRVPIITTLELVFHAKI
jgi:hypothetical protein